MSIAVSAVFEVRTATGSSTNGGGWVPGSSGTDYSQQTSPQYSLTNGTTNGTTTILTASAASDMVGNVAYIAGGTGSITATWKQITAVSVGVSITVDSSSGLTTGTGVTIHIGGALDTLTDALAIATQNNIIWCSGSQTVTSTVTLTLAASGSSVANEAPFTIIGYTSVRGDNGKFTLTTATNSVNLITANSNSGQFLFENILFSSTAGSPGNGFEAGTAGAPWDYSLVNCRLTGFSTGIWGPFNTQYFFAPISLNNTEIDHCGIAIENLGMCILVNSYIHDCTTDGLNQLSSGGQGTGGIVALGTVFANNGTNGIAHNTSSNTNQPTSAVIVNCALYNNTTAGYNFGVGVGQQVTLIFYNNIIYGNGTGCNSNSGSPTLVGFIDYNAYGGNTTNRTNFPTGAHDVTLTGNPFNNPSSGDFTLNSTAGAGAACKAAGYQSTII